MAKKKSEERRYEIDGNGPYRVRDGEGTEYDLIKSKREAEAIRDVLNEGKGPDWDLIEDEVKRRTAAR